MSSHGSSANNGGGWFGVIAPRPSTPTFPKDPTSPDRTTRPNLVRVPSQDAMQRSIHNDSGHGKSTAQMVKDLRASNAKLSQKTADMEAEFMNQVNEMSSQFQEQLKEAQEKLKQKEDSLKTIESRYSSAESRVRERDGQVTKLKEETQFQRHAIADLKNQLYQLQHEIEEAECDRFDETDKWELEKKELTREMELIRTKLLKYQDDEPDVLNKWKQLDDTQNQLAESKTALFETQSQLASMENDFKRQQKEHLNEINLLKSKISEQQSIARQKELQMVDRVEDANEGMQELKEQLAERDGTIDALREETTKLTDQIATQTRDLAKLRAQGQADDQYRANEARDLRLVNDSSKKEIASLKTAVESLERELDEKDEALVEKVEKEKAFEAKEQEFTASERELTTKLQTLEKELIQVKEASSAVGDEQMGMLKKQLEETRDSSKKLESELVAATGKYEKEAASLKAEMKQNEDKYQFEIRELRTEIKELIADRDDVESQLKRVQEERDARIQKLIAERNSLMDDVSRLEDVLDGTTKSVETSVAREREEVETRAEKRLKDVVASAARERADLEGQFQKHLSELKLKLAELTKQKGAQQSEFSLHAEETKKELKRNQIVMAEKNAEIETLHMKLAATEKIIEESSSTSSQLEKSMADLKSCEEKLKQQEEKSEKAKKQLREAQIALVALDDEKVVMLQQHKDQIIAMEKARNELELQHQEQLSNAEEQSKAKEQMAENVLVVERLQRELKDKDVQLERARNKSRSVDLDGYGYGGESSLRRELIASKETQEELSRTIQLMREERDERDEQQKKLREKLEDRDTTISALVKSSVTQEAKVSSLKSEIATLNQKIDAITNPGPENEAVHKARNAEYIDEIETLQTALDDAKEGERRLQHEVESLERRLFDNESETRRLKDQVTKNGTTSRNNSRNISDMATDHAERLHERDAAIAQLVKQSMSLESEISRVKAENAALMTGSDGIGTTNVLSRQATPSWEEVKRLQKESEIFAGQIIEQDEEMEALRSDLQEKEKRIDSLQRELSSWKRKANRERDSDRIIELQAELDEIQEANDTQRAELRDLRKQLREAKKLADDALDLKAELEQAKYLINDMKSKAGQTARGDADVRSQLQKAIAAKDEQEQKHSQTIEAMRRQRNAAIESLEEKLRGKDQVIADLEEELESSDKVKNNNVKELEREIQRLNDELDDQHDMIDDAKLSNKELKKLLDETTEKLDEATKKRATDEISDENLLKEVEELRGAMKMYEEDKNLVDAMKQRLALVDEEKEIMEKNIIDTYERRMGLMQLNKDVIIDGLRKDLVETKSTTRDSLNELERTVQDLHGENKDLKDELEAKLQLKNTKIHALEQTLGAQEQLVENMRSEMDHLQTTMQRTSLSRRAEIEEMQQEMINTSSKSQRQDREISSLKMELEEARLNHRSEVTRLRDQLDSIDKMDRSPSEREIKTRTEDKVNGMKERLENMRWRNTNLTEENEELRNRLERAEVDGLRYAGESRKNTKLEEEMKELKDKIMELEEAKVTMKARSTSSPQKVRERSSRTLSNKPPTGSSAEQTSRRERSRIKTKSKRMASPSPIRKSSSQTSSPTKRSQASPLRFLKRRSQKETAAKSKDDLKSKDTPVTAGSEESSGSSATKYF